VDDVRQAQDFNHKIPLQPEEFVSRDPSARQCTMRVYRNIIRVENAQNDTTVLRRVGHAAPNSQAA